LLTLKIQTCKNDHDHILNKRNITDKAGTVTANAKIIIGAASIRLRILRRHYKCEDNRY
jgi:hypothetical protein